MAEKKGTQECRDCLDKMYKLEEELEAAYAEENDILIEKLLSELEGVNEQYAQLRKARKARKS
jgi:hypothetical protein